MSIILVRHGETALNVARVLQPADTPLSERGLAQAEAVAQRLGTLGVAAIVSSDLPRALRTAQAISAATGAAIETSPLLQERNFGDLRGQAYDTLGFNALTMDDAPPGGESTAAFRQRVDAAFADAVARHARIEGNLAFVTHGLVIREIVSRLVQLGEGVSAPASIGNTSITVVSGVAPHGVDLLDCTVHLDAGAKDNAGNLSGG